MLVGSIAFVTTGFWMLMIFDCVRNEPKGSNWLWLLIILNFPAAIVYFAVRKLPDLALPIPDFLKHWRMKETLWNAEAGVRDIGKSHEYIALGDVLLKMGKLDRALECYQSVLINEKDNSDALWGCATIEIKRGKLHRAMEYLNTLLIDEPNYKRGEASLQYGKVLYELAQWSPAKTHLQGDVDRWGHSESLLLLAKVSLYYDDDRIAARDYLEAMFGKLKASPKSNCRKHQCLIREARKLQKTLG
jgi:tetratricopeptide (TPR) repeat protein